MKQTCSNESMMLAAYEHSRGAQAVFIEDFDLNTRETTCIKSLLLGKRNQELAREMGVSSQTLEFYMKNIEKKCNCVNTEQLLRFIACHSQS